MKASTGKRVLMLLENNPYPEDPRVRAEARTLLGAGYRVTVICPGRADQPRREDVDGVRVRRFTQPNHGSGSWGYVWEYGYSMAAALILSLAVWLRDGIDIVHAHNPPDTFVFIAAFFKLLGKPFVFDQHDLAPEMYRAVFGPRARSMVYRGLILCEKLSCRLADHVIATNESYKLVEMRRGSVSENRITIVRNAPDLERLKPVAPDPALRRKAPTVIGYAGVMGAQDGVDGLLRALRRLLTDLGRRDWYCVLVGQGPAWRDLKALSRELGLDDRVWFTGYIPHADLVRYLSTADICVDPDPSNPFNDRSTMIKMMDYMALGKPIVAFDLPEHRRSAAAAAVYVRPNDELEFARTLACLMDDPARRQAMGAFGRKRVETDLSWRHSAANLLQAYRTIVPGQSSPNPASTLAGGVQ